MLDSSSCGAESGARARRFSCSSHRFISQLADARFAMAVRTMVPMREKTPAVGAAPVRARVESRPAVAPRVEAPRVEAPRVEARQVDAEATPAALRAARVRAEDLAVAAGRSSSACSLGRWSAVRNGRLSPARTSNRTSAWSRTVATQLRGRSSGALDRTPALIWNARSILRRRACSNRTETVAASTRASARPWGTASWLPIAARVARAKPRRQAGPCSRACATRRPIPRPTPCGLPTAGDVRRSTARRAHLAMTRQSAAIRLPGV